LNLLKLFSLATSLLLFSQMAFAIQPAPKECPSLSKIKQGDFRTFLLGHSEKLDESMYQIYQINNFDTPQTWLFLTLAPGQTPAQAISFTITRLDTLNTPNPRLRHGVWECGYDDDTGAITIADDKGGFVAPSPEQAMSLLK